MRLFVAVTPPSEIRERVVKTYSEIERARWVPKEQLHVTLRFLGEIDATLAARVQEALREVSAPALTIRLKGLGTFGRPPRVLWCGLEPAEAISNLASAIEEKVVQLGLQSADHPFTPHLTLARFKHSPPVMVRRHLESNEAFETPLFSITELTLYQSELNQDGARHTPLEIYPLGART